MQPLPREDEAEKVILSIALARPDCFNQILELVDEKHFYVESSRKLFAQMKRLHQEGKAFVAAELYKQAGVLPSELSELIGYAPVTNLTPYCQSVLDAWRRREAIRILHEGGSKLMSEKGSIEIISELQAALIGLCKGTETNLFTLSQSLSSAYQIICDSMESREFPGVPY